MITIDDVLPISEQIREVGEGLISADQHGAAQILFDLAWRVARLERTLDEIVRDAQEDAMLGGGK